MDYLQVLSTSDAQFDFFPWLLWYIWKARNGKMFENVDKCPLDVTKRAQYEAKAWREAQVEDQNEQAHDGSMFMGASNLRRSLTPLHSEVEALVWGMRCMISHDFRDVVFLTDCSYLVKMVSSPSEWPAFSVYLNDIQVDREEFSTLLFLLSQGVQMALRIIWPVKYESYRMLLSL
ncbi:uncharacterized protein LOC111830455 [Capsella rubella]|uniref:uncharacterized protein LOC111830455 n=1 Tax=Capsella rubella TaxID=81985 RepID=UPI000CD537C5|nr:uncharacterized protein LOC111830455 [Capsella rubella]